MSGFNKKSFKETFSNRDKVIIYILSLIVFTTGFIYIDKVIACNCFLNNSSNGNMNNQGSSVTYSASKEITSDEEITDGEYSTNEKDQNAILVSGDITAKLSNITVSKTGDSDGGDATSFYGNNSAILAKDKANLTLSNITVETNATGDNGVFS